MFWVNHHCYDSNCHHRVSQLHHIVFGIRFGEAIEATNHLLEAPCLADSMQGSYSVSCSTGAVDAPDISSGWQQSLS